MDKETLSNYGWIVICVLVLAVMIALATPFGNYIKDAVWSTTHGLFDVNQNALNAVGMGGVSTVSDSELVYEAASGNYTVGSYYGKNGILATNAIRGHTDLIPVVEGEKYSFSLSEAHSSTTFAVIVTFDAEQNPIKGYSLSDVEALEGSGRVSKYEHEYAYITIPEGVSFISINCIYHYTDTYPFDNEQIWVYKGNFDETKLHSYTSKISGTNNLTGKSMIVFGDSIIHGQITKEESFATYIAEANNMTVVENGLSGAKSTAIMSKFNSTSLTGYDYIIVEGFINDVNATTTLGELTPVGSTEFDATTFIGALEEAIYNYKESGNTAKLGFVLTKVKNSHALQRQYWDAAISVFEKYNVSYLDLYSTDYECIWDKVHPSFDGQLKIAELVETWMNTL